MNQPLVFYWNKCHKIILLLFISILLKGSFVLVDAYRYKKINRCTLSNYKTILIRNDAVWYQNIFLYDYPKIDKKNALPYLQTMPECMYAFFPGLPYATKAIQYFLNASAENSILIATMLFSTCLFVIFYLYLQSLKFSEDKAFFTTLVLMLFPFNYYFSMYYTEALFMLLLIGAVWMFSIRKNLLAGLFMGGLVLTRPNGLVLLLPLYMYFLTFNAFFAKQGKSTLKYLAHLGLSSCVFLIPALFFACFCYYQYMQTGDFFMFSDAQNCWQRKWTYPWETLFYGSSLDVQFNSFFTIALFLFIYWRRRIFSLADSVFIFLSLFLILSSGFIISMPRYCSVLFPIPIAIAALIYDQQYKYGVLFFFWLMQCYMFQYWLDSHPLSY